MRLVNCNLHQQNARRWGRYSLFRWVLGRPALILGLASSLALWGGSASADPLIPQAEDEPAPKPFQNTASYSYTDPATNFPYGGQSNALEVINNRLVDPFGQILGCGGQELPSYIGFSTALYDPDPADQTQTELGRIVDLTPSEFPDIEGNGIPGGLTPNITNANPFFLRDSDRGKYNFLFDPNRGQTLPPGRVYILVIRPPANSIYQERRVKITIVDSTGAIGNNVVRYTAQSLDGQPISARGGTQVTNSVVFVPNAETVGLDLLSLQFTSLMCEPNQVAITKTADRATAEPGDIVIYRVSVRSQSDVALQGVTVTDVLPRGMTFLPRSVRGEIAGKPVAITTDLRKNTILIVSDAIVPAGGVLNLTYGAQVSPDSIRGNGRNSAIVAATRTDNNFSVKAGPVSHQLRIRPGLLSDAGTLIGRVFDDKNFDGEQQPGEPGIANAVIFLQDGNRVMTDEKGLFSVANAQPGYYTGTLDLSSIPGYKTAPNDVSRERNSDSRLVRLAPGSLAKINFAVTPLQSVTSPKPLESNLPSNAQPEVK
jgi:uncharacterized repeat protein (TIGR01451 family)